MKDPSAAIRKAVVDKVRALGYSCYDRIPDTQSFPFVWVTNQSVTPFNTQDQWGYECSIDCVVVTGWTKEQGGKLEADTMCNAINNAIVTRPANLTITGYYAPIVISDNIDSFEERTDTHIIYTKIARFKLTLYES